MQSTSARSSSLIFHDPAGGSAATCLATMTLFLFAFSNKAIASVLLLLFFGLAVLCTLGSVLAFEVEMVLGNRARRRRISFHLPRLAWRRSRER